MTLKIFGSHDEATIKQAQRVLDTGADHFVLCADGHLGYSHPIGGVALYKDKISLSGVGFDIGCGNLAVRLPLKLNDILPRMDAIVSRITSEISFGIGGTSLVSNDEWEGFLGYIELTSADLRSCECMAPNLDLARTQLGTVGGGNHYVDVFYDDDLNVWVGVHFGSRGFGHKITKWFMDTLGAKDDMNSDPVVLEAKSDLGDQYLEAMYIAGDYAQWGRELVVRQVANILLDRPQNTDRIRYEEAISNHHNYAWREMHDGTPYWVVRKGATPISLLSPSFIGGNMRDPSFIIEGRNSVEDLKECKWSTVHGAGRILSRRQAAGKFKYQNGTKVQVTQGLVNEADMRADMAKNNIVLLGGGADESPECYKKLREVLAYHDASVKVRTVLYPVIVAMAGANDTDPYKD